MFKDVSEFVADSMDLVVAGKTYHVPPVSALEGLKLQRIITLSRMVAAGNELSPEDQAELELDDNAQEQLYRRLLGPVFDEMLEDGVSWIHFERACNAAVVLFLSGIESAEATWNEAPGKPRRRQPQDHRPKKTTQSPSGSTTTL